jgi:phosphate transport system substrate-binding protein
MSAPSVRLLGPVLALGLVAAACGSSSKSNNTTSNTTGAAATATTTVTLAPATLNGSGSTFQKAFDQDQIQAFQAKHSGVTINYAGGGSGKGQQDLADQVVDFAGSDSAPVKDATIYKGGALLYFPTVVAPITVSYKLSGVTTLTLSADTIAKIFSRQIKTWDDAAIKADNPSASLPSTAITVVHRSDGSGTTNNFTTYLKSAAPSSWTLGSGSTVPWPTDTQAGNGNAGVAQAVKATDGAVGYVDLADAKASGLTFASVKNSAGKAVAPTLAGASAALVGVTVKPDLTYNPLNSSAPDAYPITSPTWILVYKTQKDKAKGAVLKAFLTFLLTDGQTNANASDYAALAPDLASKALTQVDQIVLPA